ncbi:hypothetical protein ACFV19_10905, partial [Streptomyces griseoluteus]
MEYVYAVGLGDLALDGTAPVTGVDGGTVRTVGGGGGGAPPAGRRPPPPAGPDVRAPPPRE